MNILVLWLFWLFKQIDFLYLCFLFSFFFYLVRRILINFRTFGGTKKVFFFFLLWCEDRPIDCGLLMGVFLHIGDILTIRILSNFLVQSKTFCGRVGKWIESWYDGIYIYIQFCGLANSCLIFFFFFFLCVEFVPVLLNCRRYFGTYLIDWCGTWTERKNWTIFLICVELYSLVGL